MHTPRTAIGLATITTVCGVAALVTAPSSNAQEYPTRNVRIIVPWAPGGTTDILARLVGEHLRSTLGAAVVVDNRPGANGTIGTELAARATADGYTLLMATSSTHVVNPNLTKVPFDPIKDFEPISVVGTTPFLLLVNQTVAVTSVRELIDLARKQPNRLNFGSYGQGSAPQLVAELFKTSAKIEMSHVPYKGSAPVLQALMAGEVGVAFDPLSTSLPHVKSGKIKALAITSAVRSPLIGDLPTLSESGVPGFEANAWYGLEAPSKTPSAVLAKLHAQIVSYLKLPDVQKRFLDLAVIPVGNTPREFAEQISRESAKWKQVIQQAGIKID